MKIVLVGATKFTARCLELISSIKKVELVGVVTAPKVFTISYRKEGVDNILYTDLNSIARKLEIPVVLLETKMNDPKLLRFITDLQPDCFIVVGWYHMVTAEWRKIAPAYGLHASLLPNYSGGAPLVWAMINGEKKTGITLFQMDAGVDSGPILGQYSVLIKNNDTIATLYDRIEKKGLKLLKNTLIALADGSEKLTIQDEEKRKVYKQRSPENGRICWEQSADDIDRFIRAQTRPYPGAFSTLFDSEFKIWSCEIKKANIENEKVGKIIKVKNKYAVICKKNLIILKEVTYKGNNYQNEELDKIIELKGGILVNNIENIK